MPDGHYPIHDKWCDSTWANVADRSIRAATCRYCRARCATCHIIWPCGEADDA